MTKKTQSKIKTLWKQGRNIWEISKITCASETEVSEFIRSL